MDNNLCVHPKVKLLWLLSDIHECSGGFQLVLSCLDEEAIGRELPNNWIERLGIDLAILCDMQFFKQGVACHFVKYYGKHSGAVFSAADRDVNNLQDRLRQTLATDWHTTNSH